MRQSAGSAGCRAMLMIEFVLNAVWLAVVVGAFTVVPRRSNRATFAIVCILIILFPIISVSDDLAFNGNSLEEAQAIIVSLLLLVAGFIALARVEHALAAPSLILVTIPSDPRSPPRV